jgi:hypothetical protein
MTSTFWAGIAKIFRQGGAFVLAALLALASAVQAATVTRMTGSFGTGATPVGKVQILITFSCEFASGPTGPCTGTYTMTIREAYCSQFFQLSNTIAFAGLDLTRTGAIGGTSTVTNGAYQYTANPDGSCAIVPNTFSTYSRPFTGTFDGTNGTIVYPPSVDARGNVFQNTGTFKAEGVAPAVFPMSVTSNITPAIANAQATIQFRPQDVGTYGSVYVFALRPMIAKEADGVEPFIVGHTVPGAGEKDTPLPCVLAQLNSSNQLQNASVSTLQAYITGVLSAQGASVSILNNVPTPNVAGATFYVGYGTSPTSMIDNGVNRSAVTVPGTRECRPQPPQTGWWWNPQQPGRGFSIEASGNNLFVAAYLYDASGRATWHVATGPTSLDGSVFSNRLLTFGGGVTLAGPYVPNARLPDAGAISLTFDDATHGTLVWPGGTVALQRYAFGPGGTGATPLAGQPQSGWWWGGAGDNGRGFFIEWQGNRAFLAGYMYDSSGNPVWYVADSTVGSAQSFAGTWLQFANGQTLTGAWRAPTLANGNVAPVAIRFQGADTAILTLPSGSLPLTRFRF